MRTYSDLLKYHREYRRRKRAADPTKAKAEARAAYEALKARQDCDPAIKVHHDAKRREWRKANADYLRDKRREDYERLKADPAKREAYRAQLRESMRRYRENPCNFAKIQARDKAGYAAWKGQIGRQPCEVCGSGRAHMHHHLGYAPEHALSVQWLCPMHHHEAHRKA